MVAQTFCVAAEEKGLGICYLGTTTYNPQMIIEALELPELVFPITTVTVGWPAEIPAQVDRLSLEAIVHEETYHLHPPYHLLSYIFFVSILYRNPFHIKLPVSQ